MPRPKSDDKRSAILAAAARLIVTEGLGATTAGIAKGARVANGSLFTYFDSKTILLNDLYLELKREMAFTATRGIPADADLRAHFFHLWRNWIEWASAYPEKRRALAQLSVSEEVTPATRQAANKALAPISDLLEHIRVSGPMHDVPTRFLAALMNSVAEVTMDQVVQDPKNAKKHTRAGFEALWRMVN